MSAQASQNQKSALFPTISQVATDTDALRNDDDVVAGDENAEGGEEEEKQMQEIESLCMRCHEQVCSTLSWLVFVLWRAIRLKTHHQGSTRLLLTSIPYFKEVVVMSFRCEHCGHRDSEVQSAEEIQRELPFMNDAAERPSS